MELPPFDSLQTDFPFTPQSSRVTSPNDDPPTFQQALDTHIRYLNAFPIEQKQVETDNSDLRTVNKLLENQAKIKKLISCVDIKSITALAKIEEAKNDMTRQSTSLPLEEHSNTLTSSSTASRLGSKSSEATTTIDQGSGDHEKDEETEDPEFTAMWKTYLLKKTQRSPTDEICRMKRVIRKKYTEKYRREWEACEKLQPVKTALSIAMAKKLATRERKARTKASEDEEERAHQKVITYREFLRELRENQQDREMKKTLLILAVGKKPLLSLEDEESKAQAERIREMEIRFMKNRAEYPLVGLVALGY